MHPHTIIWYAADPFPSACRKYSFESQKVQITTSYETISEPEVTRTLNLSRMIATSLPVAINVEDFFRGTRHVYLFPHQLRSVTLMT